MKPTRTSADVVVEFKSLDENRQFLTEFSDLEFEPSSNCWVLSTLMSTFWLNDSFRWPWWSRLVPKSFINLYLFKLFFSNTLSAMVFHKTNLFQVLIEIPKDWCTERFNDLGEDSSCLTLWKRAFAWNIRVFRISIKESEFQHYYT